MNTSVLAAPAQLLTTPSIAYHALMPIFIVLGAALLALLVEAFVPRERRFGTQIRPSFRSDSDINVSFD